MSHGLGGNRHFRAWGRHRRIDGPVFLSERLGLPGDALPQRALLLAQGSLAAWRVQDLRWPLHVLSTVTMKPAMTAAGLLGLDHRSRLRQRHLGFADWRRGR